MRPRLETSGFGSHSGSARDNDDLAVLSLTASIALAAALVLGGAGADFPLIGATVQLACLFPLGCVLFLSTQGRARLGWPFAAAALIAAIPLVQLLPLPPELWRALPGRELAVEIWTLLGEAGEWKPLSLDPEKTVTSLLELLPGLALMLAALNLGRRGNARLVHIVLAGAIVSWLVALIQRSSGGGSANLFSSSQASFGPGLFVNRNHQATMLLMAMPLAAHAFRAARDKIPLAQAVGAAFVFLLCTGVLITRSRTGLALLPIALAASLLILLPIRWNRLSLACAAAAAILIGGVASQAPAVQATLIRFATAGEQRTDYWRDTTIAIRRFWPVGSGVGTFAQVYPTVEGLDVVGTHEVNNAHNDYLELTLEGGAPAVVLMLAFMLFLAGAAVKLVGLRRRGHDISLGAACWAGIFVLLLHSLLDYPLRMMSIMAVFGLLCGLLIRSISPEEPHGNATEDTLGSKRT